MKRLMRNFKLNDVKRFMHLFLNGTIFDDLQLVEGMIRKYTSKIKMDGKWYYRTEWSTNTNADAAIPVEVLKVTEEK